MAATTDQPNAAADEAGSLLSVASGPRARKYFRLGAISLVATAIFFLLFVAIDQEEILSDVVLFIFGFGLLLTVLFTCLGLVTFVVRMCGTPSQRR